MLPCAVGMESVIVPCTAELCGLHTHIDATPLVRLEYCWNCDAQFDGAPVIVYPLPPADHDPEMSKSA